MSLYPYHYNGPVPVNEADRVRAMMNCHLSSSEDEDLFECVVEMAKKFFGTTYALLTVIEQHEQWFKAPRSLGVPPMDRGISFCTHAIMGQNVLVVNDAREHPLFKNNPLVTGWPHVRFYAGAPVMLHRQYAVGTICVLDEKPRDFNAHEQAMMNSLAEIAAVLLERRLPFLEYIP